MTTANITLPADKIAQALDLLVYHGVLTDSTADHHLGEFLQEVGMTLEAFVEAR